MLRFPRTVTGAAAGAALLMLGTMSGHTQVGPLGSTTPGVETSRQLELIGTREFLGQGANRIGVKLRIRGREIDQIIGVREDRQ